LPENVRWFLTDSTVRLGPSLEDGAEQVLPRHAQNLEMFTLLSPNDAVTPEMDR